MSQIAIPMPLRPEEVARERTLGGALELCAKVAGFAFDKQLQQTLEVDKGQFSRWQSGQEGIKWDKFTALMDACGNDAPLLWMLHARGYDLHSIRRVENAVERENRELREQLAAARKLLIGVAS